MNSALLNPHLAQPNLILAWIWIVLGFGWGSFLGMNFHRDAWLEGYSSFKRRLYRLAHVAFFGLGLINLLFYFTVRTLTQPSPWVQMASWAFIAGMVTMPICCVIAAHFPKARALFVVPVGSLLLAGILTVLEVL